jgi:hypothetical protein
LSTLRAVGRDEYWLQESIAKDPNLLGLGPVTLKAKELRQHVNKGSRLNILAYDAALDTYYEVEVMLGECDADHGFRTLDYWARERLRSPNARHVAVLVAENLAGRTVIETLSQYVPLIAVEIRTLVLNSDPPLATTFPVIVSQPDDLVLRPADEPESKDEGVARAMKLRGYRSGRSSHALRVRCIASATKRSAEHDRLLRQELYCTQEGSARMVTDVAT